MLSLRKLRGLLGTTAVWAAAFAIVGGGYIAQGAFRGLLPPLPGASIYSFILARVARAAMMGGAAGIAFSMLVMFGERRRSFRDLTTTRFAAWGFVAGAGIFTLVNGAVAMQNHIAIDSGLLVWSGVYGAVGAAIGALTCRLAKRRPVALDEPLPAAERGPVT